jgi:nitrite reductase (NO-forming)
LNVVETIDLAAARRSDRRAFLGRMAGMGLAIPAVVALGPATARAEDGHAMSAPATGQAQPYTPYDPFLQAAQPGTKDLLVTASDAVLPISRGDTFGTWTFDGTVPGKALRVVEGDTINFTFAVDPDALTTHSLDFHSAKTPPDVNYRTLSPGESLSYSFAPKYPGTYMYHCGTPPVLMHLAAGMYGAMIVDPKEGWAPAQELVLVQSEFYLMDGENGVKTTDYEKTIAFGPPDYVAFNGHAHQYVDNPIKLRAGEPVRIFVVNAGPNIWSSFHVVGTIFDRVLVNGNPKNALVGLQSITIGPGDGAVVEFVLDEPGSYPAVNHGFNAATKGAVAVLQAE